MYLFDLLVYHIQSKAWKKTPSNR